MKKSIKILICILIVIMIIPLDCYAESDEKYWTVKKIANYYKNNGSSKFEEQSDEVLKEWYNTFYAKYGEGRRIKNSNNKYGNAYTCICNLLNERGINTENYYEDVNGDISVNFWRPTINNNTEFFKKAGVIVGVIQVFGSVVSVLFLVIIGIKYILGSASEKAKYKEVMIPYIVGCIMLFATTNIASILYKIGTSFN